MKYISFAATFLMLAFVMTSCKKKQVDVNSQTEFPESFYENDWNGAQQAAQTQNRKIFVDFYATWCTICADFKTNTLGDSTVREYIKNNYVAVALDGEKEGKSMYDQLGSGSYPVLAIYNNDGTLVTSFNGKKNSADFIAWLEQYK